MMEIVYGPVIVNCALQSIAFGVVFGLAFSAYERRVAGLRGPMVGRGIGTGLMAGGLFGLVHLVTVCAADGFPPRIIQSTGMLLLIVSMIGAALVMRSRATLIKA